MVQVENVSPETIHMMRAWKASGGSHCGIKITAPTLHEGCSSNWALIRSVRDNWLFWSQREEYSCRECTEQLPWGGSQNKDKEAGAGHHGRTGLTKNGLSEARRLFESQNQEDRKRPIRKTLWKDYSLYMFKIANQKNFSCQSVVMFPYQRY